MTARDYAALLIQAYGPARALAMAQNHAGSDLDHDGFWTRVLKIIRSKQPMKPTKTQLAAMAELQAATTQARDIGREYFAIGPDMMLVEVARQGAALYPHRKDCEVAFLQGYIEARTNHDAFKHGE